MLFGTILAVAGVLVVFVAAMSVMRVARSLRRDALKDVQLDTDFSIDELHRLHLAGNLSREEFERAKRVVLNRQPIKQIVKGHAFEVLPPPKDPPA